MGRAVLCGLFGCLLLCLTAMAMEKHWDYIIVGGGPGGVQLGYFMTRSNRNYIILERGKQPGTFFTYYPRHNTLISINKRFTGKTNKEFNFRHDWNSLISDDESLLFGRYTDEMFPKRQIYVKYIKDYVDKLNLNIQYNTDVSNITRLNTDSEKRFVMTDQHGNVYTCRDLIIATGIWTPVTKSEVEGMEYTEGYENLSLNKTDFDGQNVLILGRGNSAFEVADYIYGHTNFIHVMGRNRVRLSWETHYVGDVRGVNNALLDTYQLKSLDAVLEKDLNNMKFVKVGNKIYIGKKGNDTLRDNFALREGYDRVIRCLGFVFNETLFNSDNIKISHPGGRAKKYPKINYDYESVDAKDMYFVGTVTHSLDHRKAAGGFIHGFRYTARALHRILEQKNFGLPWTNHNGSYSDLIPTFLKRINEASGIYQMFSVLGDVILLNENGFQYVEEFPLNLLSKFEHYTGLKADKMIVLALEYGANFSGPGHDIFRFDRAVEKARNAHQSNFLHPVLYFYKSVPTDEDMKARHHWQVLPRPERVHHMVEDFLTTWNAPLTHILPLRRFFEYAIGFDIRNQFADDCFQMALTYNKLPYSCQEQYLHGKSVFRLDQFSM